MLSKCSPRLLKVFSYPFHGHTTTRTFKKDFQKKIIFPGIGFCLYCTSFQGISPTPSEVREKNCPVKIVDCEIRGNIQDELDHFQLPYEESMK